MRLHLHTLINKLQRNQITIVVFLCQFPILPDSINYCASRSARPKP